MLAVQQYLIDLKNRGLTLEQSLEYLKANTGIEATVYPEAGVMMLNYNQINSPKTVPTVIECRSLILNLNDFSIASRKFDRFFNAGEAPDTVADFDINRAVAFEKADGSLIGFWFCNGTGRYEISTRGMAFAEGPHVLGGSFRDHILAALGVTEDEFQEIMHQVLVPGDTIIGEYVGPDNKIVTKYEFSHVVITGISTGGEAAVSHSNTLASLSRALNNFGMRTRSPKVYPAKDSLAELIAEANALPNLEEGFVVCDPVSNKRVKIKSASYLVAHRLRGNDPVPTRKNMLELIFEGEVGEFLLYFPEHTALVEGLQEEVKTFLKNVTEAYESAKHIESQKDFALAIAGKVGTQYMFSARKLNKTVEEVFNMVPTAQKIKQFV